MTAGQPEWLREARGGRPIQRWTFTVDARLTDVRLARETGETLAADESGGLYWLDANGRVSALTRTSHELSQLALADTATAGAVIVDRRQVAWLDRRLQFVWERTLPDEILSVAVDPYGTHLLVTLAGGINVVFNADKKKVAEFESLRPLRFVQWLAKEPAFLAAADYGFFARYTLNGQLDWDERLWSTVADLSTTGDGGMVALAGLAHGIQIYDEQGTAEGSFVLDGTACLVSASYHRQRIIAATLERHLVLLDAEGAMKWLVQTPETIVRLQMSALGDAVIVGFTDGRIVQLETASGL